MVNWTAVADYAQRGISLTLFGLSLVGLAILGQGGYMKLQKRRLRKEVVRFH